MIKVILAFIFCSLSLHAKELNKTDYTVICYHDFIKNHDGNSYSVYIANLIEQFEYLKANYNVIGFEDVILANKGLKKLPSKAVVLTVDDGLKSFETIFLPLLKLYNFKATFAVVGKWSDEGRVSGYSAHNFKEPDIANWERLKELSKSKLVQVVSHSYDLHNSVMFNPQGNRSPSAGYLKYNFIDKKYESKNQFKSRIKYDLKKMNQLIRKNIGTSPRIMVWPFGSFNGLSQEVAKELGLNINFSIESGFNKINNLDIIYRDMIMSSTTLSDFSKILNGNYHKDDPVRSLKIELEQIWNKNPKIRRTNINRLLDSIKEINPNIVLINPDKLFSLNIGQSASPLINSKSNFLNHLSHTIKSRAGVDKTYIIVNLSKGLNPKKVLKNIENFALRTDLNGYVFRNLPSDEADQQFRSLITKKLKKIRPFWTKNIFINSSQFKKVKPDAKNFKNIFVNFNNYSSQMNQELQKITKLIKNNQELQNKLVPHIHISNEFTKKNKINIAETLSHFLKNGFKNYSLRTNVANFNNLSFLQSQLSKNDFPYKTRRAN